MVSLHRWMGLTMAAFIVVLGLTGGTLAFRPQLDRLLAPEIFVGPHGATTLDLASLLRLAEAAEPGGRVSSISLRYQGTAAVAMEPISEDKPLDFDTLYLDDVTGAVRGRIQQGRWPRQPAEIIPFIYALHYQLAAGDVGAWILGLVALTWTINCFVGFYLTLPSVGRRSSLGFIEAWKPSWLVKRGASVYRTILDIHRVTGLWLWAALLVFAWSGVYMDLNGFYSRVTGLLLDYEQPIWARAPLQQLDANRNTLEWSAALETGQRLMEHLAREQNFTIGRPVAFSFMPDKGLYEYVARSSRDIGDSGGRTTIDFDAHDGSLKFVSLPTGQRSGVTLTTILVELHMANIFGLAYKLFVAVFALSIIAIAVTGIFIWAIKRDTRNSHKSMRVSTHSR
jgi:uncharacterized iron-regulated membrane protein